MRLRFNPRFLSVSIACGYSLVLFLINTLVPAGLGMRLHRNLVLNHPTMEVHDGGCVCDDNCILSHLFLSSEAL